MNWKGCAVLVAVFGWFGGTFVLAEDARHRGCHHQHEAKQAPPTCPACDAQAARRAEIERLRAEIAKLRGELASLQKPQAPPAAEPQKADRPWLGLQVGEGCCGRLEITGVADGSPAAAAGIQKGDTLLLWGDQGVLCVKDLQGLAGQVSAGDKVTLTVLRQHAWIKADVTRPADAAAPAQPAQPAPPAEQPAQPAEEPAKPADEPAQPAEGQPEGQPEEPPTEEPK